MLATEIIVASLVSYVSLYLCENHLTISDIRVATVDGVYILWNV